MKQSNTCPKCKSTDIVRVPPFKGTSTSNLIQLTKWGTKFCYFDRYICSSCGYTEEYADVQDKSWQSWIDDQIKAGSLDSDFV
ncbi:MAG: hypothetical protein IPP15_02890 [Saprospiraceae bacterium]|uniref:Uncharacterized protein n=1 Tax=Candidatus Opimibacter skivensis TaxID=2982028 RepID=A0A9D7SUU7_9BACT|nr:hypothetical protein [Candidatus Opimibacter skivensis]